MHCLSLWLIATGSRAEFWTGFRWEFRNVVIFYHTVCIYLPVGKNHLPLACPGNVQYSIFQKPLDLTGQNFFFWIFPTSPFPSWLWGLRWSKNTAPWVESLKWYLGFDCYCLFPLWSCAETHSYHANCLGVFNIFIFIWATLIRRYKYLSTRTKWTSFCLNQAVLFFISLLIQLITMQINNNIENDFPCQAVV